MKQETLTTIDDALHHIEKLKKDLDMISKNTDASELILKELKSYLAVASTYFEYVKDGKIEIHSITEKI